MYFIEEPQRQTRVLAKYDTVVVGGGIAGVAAAVAAARNGASVCLIEKENALGGLATLGLIVVYLPICDGMGRQVMGGLGEELLKLSLKYGGPDKIPECWLPGGDIEERKKERYKVEFNAALYMIALEELLLKEGVDILYDTRFCSVIIDNKRITHVIIENKEGRSAVSAKTIVDASGDADVCFASGERTAEFCENRLAAWNYFTDGSSVKINKLAHGLYIELPEGARTYNGLLEKDINAMLIDGRKMVLEDMLKKRKKYNNEQILPITIPTIPSFRMTRRIVGFHEIAEADDKKYYEDCVAITGDWRNPGPILYLPYASLFGSRVDNLITAGRCISAKTDAWDITRVIPTCAVTGEAAGTAAALCAKAGCDFKDYPVKDLQQRLREQGAYVDEII